MQKIALITVMALTATFSQAQTCQTNIKNKTPDSRYQLLNNGSEVKDLKTGLVWQRCSLGQTWGGTTCTGTAIPYTWQKALQAAKDAGNGLSLPNIKELKSLANQACYNPAINDTYFPNMPFSQAAYWSSSPVFGDGHGEFISEDQGFGDTGSAWLVYFNQGYGDSDFKTNAFFVRLVRASQ